MPRTSLLQRHPFLVGAALIFFFQEVVVFVWAPLWWAGLDPESEVRLLLVADPQLQGKRDEPPGIFGTITRTDSDWYLWRTFLVARWYAQANAVVFLGDLLDEGMSADKECYQDTVSRFHAIYNSPHLPAVYVGGDNDVGGESEPVDSERRTWFSRAFPDSPVSLLPPSLTHRFRILKANVFDQTTASVRAPSNVSAHPLVLLLSHHPILDTFGMFRFSADEIRRKVNPVLILSAHDHVVHLVNEAGVRDGREGAAVETTLGPGLAKWSGRLGPGPLEFQIPTTSYRMGVSQMAIGVLSIRFSPYAQVELVLLYSGSRFWKLGLYGLLFGASALYYLSTILPPTR